MRGGGDPQIISLVFFVYNFEVVQLVFSIIQNHLPPQRNSFQKYFEVRELFLGNSGTTTKYFICNLSEIILTGWVVSKELFWVVT
jgi:hypothetical protein